MPGAPGVALTDASIQFPVTLSSPAGTAANPITGVLCYQYNFQGQCADFKGGLSGSVPCGWQMADATQVLFPCPYALMTCTDANGVTTNPPPSQAKKVFKAFGANAYLIGVAIDCATSKGSFVDSFNGATVTYTNVTFTWNFALSGISALPAQTYTATCVTGASNFPAGSTTQQFVSSTANTMLVAVQTSFATDSSGLTNGYSLTYTKAPLPVPATTTTTTGAPTGTTTTTTTGAPTGTTTTTVAPTTTPAPFSLQYFLLPANRPYLYGGAAVLGLVVLLLFAAILKRRGGGGQEVVYLEQ